MASIKASILDVLDIEPAVALSDEQKKMIFLLIAIGEPSSQVAAKFRLSQERIDSLIRGQEGMNEIMRMQTALFPDPQVRIKKLSHLAIDNQIRLMLTAKNEGVKAKIASDLLDRGVGKAVQVIENRNAGLSMMDVAAADRALVAQEERLARLEAMQKRLIEAESKTVREQSLPVAPVSQPLTALAPEKS